MPDAPSRTPARRKARGQARLVSGWVPAEVVDLTEQLAAALGVGPLGAVVKAIREACERRGIEPKTKPEAKSTGDP